MKKQAQEILVDLILKRDFDNANKLMKYFDLPSFFQMKKGVIVERMEALEGENFDGKIEIINFLLEQKIKANEIFQEYNSTKKLEKELLEFLIEKGLIQNLINEKEKSSFLNDCLMNNSIDEWIIKRLIEKYKFNKLEIRYENVNTEKLILLLDYLEDKNSQNNILLKIADPKNNLSLGQLEIILKRGKKKKKRFLFSFHPRKKKRD